jgi:hypothetical protein
MAKNSWKEEKSIVLRVPGFNADASLYTSPRSYRSSVGSGGTAGAVQPAFDFGQCDSEFCRLTVYHGNLFCICRFPP